MVRIRKFGTRANDHPVFAYELTSKFGFKAVILDQGAILQSFCLPNGRNIAVGFKDWESYATDTNYIGRIIGPNANRISNARFSIDDQAFDLSANDGLHNLHSGPNGFDVQSWQVEENDTGLSLTLDTQNGQNGFTGATQAHLRISLHGHRLRVEMEAKCDRPTPMNMTWHPYWNLSRDNRIDGCDLRIDADFYSIFEAGDKRPVKDTRQDFRKLLPIGSTRLDTNYKEVKRASLKAHGVSMNVTSSLPDMQVYTGDALNVPRSGIAIEPQFQPNDINLAQDSLLRPGKIYRHWIEYKFDLI